MTKPTRNQRDDEYRLTMPEPGETLHVHVFGKGRIPGMIQFDGETKITMTDCVFINAWDERQVPLPPGLTAEEQMQTVESAWNGLTIALALVLACFVAGLMLAAAARAGWL